MLESVTILQLFVTSEGTYRFSTFETLDSFLGFESFDCFESLVVSEIAREVIDAEVIFLVHVGTPGLKPFIADHVPH